MKKFEARIEELRADLIESVIEILKQNNLKEIQLSYLMRDPTFVIWFDDNGFPHECQVVKVSYYENVILFSVLYQETSDDVEEVHQIEEINSRHNLGAKNIDWINDVRSNILETLELNKTNK